MSGNTVPLRPVATLQDAASGPVLLDEFSFASPEAGLRLGGGWGLPEATMRWSLGARSDLTVGLSAWPADDRRVLGIIEATPYLGGNPQASQRITVWVNGMLQCKTALRRPSMIAFPIPEQAIGLNLAIRLDHPDARAPASLGQVGDDRQLGFACARLQFWSIPRARRRQAAMLQPVTTTQAETMAAFESLGDNCEFGIAQRLSGCEPLGLLRFTATALPSLIDLLMHEADGLGDPDTIALDLRGEPAEYILTERRYDLTYHTFIYADDMPQARALYREAQKLTLLRRRWLDDLRSGRRIYVVKHNAPLRDEDVVALFIKLRSFGPNRLLHVTLADAQHPPGTVDLLMPGLARGYIDRFAPYDDAAAISLPCWLTLCRTAERVLG